MSNIAQRGKVQTVLGTIDPSELGPVMTHEHLLIDFELMFDFDSRIKNDPKIKELSTKPVSMENLGLIRQYVYSNLDNLTLSDKEVAIKEASQYKSSGGGTIVDATTIGIGRDPKGLKYISEKSGVHIVMGAGYYVEASHSKETSNFSEDEIANQIIKDIQVGVDETSIKAGIIGEIGCTWPLTKNEIKVLKGAGKAQIETGASILIHPGRNENAPIEILDILKQSGADLHRVIIGHLDRITFDIKKLTEIASSGCFLEWDLFGTEVSFYQLSDFEMPNDSMRMNIIKSMTDEGFGEKIVVSHDICTKHRLLKYGGHGYGYILNEIVPRMHKKDFSKLEIQNIIENNAATILSIK